MCIAQYVVTLKNSVPADWMVAAHHAERPAPAEWRPGKASQVCIAPPPVKRIEPMKNVTASRAGPTKSA